MKIFKAILVTIFLISQISSGYAIGKPEVLSPTSDDVSLRPKITLTPVKNAASYSYKLKQVDASTGQKITDVESGTVTGTNQFRITTTLTAGNYYKLTLRAVNASNVKSDKVKFYFQAKDKHIYVAESELALITETQNFTRAGLLIPTGWIYASADLFATANFKLPDGAIITRITAALKENDASDKSTVVFSRIQRDGETHGFFQQAVQDEIATISTDDSADSEDQRVFTATISDDSTLTVNNDSYQYYLYVWLINSHRFYYAKIHYID